MPPVWLNILERWLLPDWHTGVALVPALFVGWRMVTQNRQRGKITTWVLFVLLFPVIGTLCFAIFGGRKILRTALIRRTVHEVANEISGAPPATEFGNSVTLLADEDGREMWDALLREIAAAQETIHITTYILGRDDVGREIVAALAKRAAAGVRVRLLVDAVGSLGSKWRLCAPLEAAGGEVFRFMPVLPLPRHWRGSANLRNHRKIAIFDGQRAIIGGQNLSAEYIGPTPNPARFRDFSILVAGPAVAALTRTFVSDWCFAARESPSAYRALLHQHPTAAGATRLEIISSGPDDPNDVLWERLLAIIQESRRRITLVTPYLVPDEMLFRVLLLKIRAGVRTRLILPKKSDHPLLDIARRPALRELQSAGAEVLFHEKPTLHAKLILIDGQVGVVGSSNLDMRSLLVNFEVVGLIHSANVVRRLALLAEKLAANSTPHVCLPLKETPLRDRAVETLGRFLAPLL